MRNVHDIVVPWVVAGVLLLGGVSYVTSSPFIYVFEAENVESIEEPMRLLRDTEASNSLCVEIPIGSGQGWKGLAGGSANYQVSVPRAGRYRFWIRSYWGDGCTNAVFVSANDSGRLLVGNDAEFDSWHWVRGPWLKLRDGDNQLVISNHSDGIKVDKIVITDSSDYEPEGIGEGITRFYDGFGGCDGNNIGSWEIVSGEWSVIPSVGDASAGANDVLAQWAPGGGQIQTGSSNWSDYSISVNTMLAGPGESRIKFFITDTAWYELRLAIGEGESVLRLVEVTPSTETLVVSSTLQAVHFDEWNTLGVQGMGDRLVLHVDGIDVASAEVQGRRTGHIALVTKGESAVYFDNVDVRFRAAKQSG